MSITAKIESKIMEELALNYGKTLTSKEILDKLTDDLDLKIDNVSLKDEINIVLKFLKKYKNVNISLDNKGEYTACLSNNTEAMIEEEIEEEKVKKELYNEKDLSVIQFIVDKNISNYIEEKDHNNNTSLHILVINNDLKRVKFLTENYHDLLFEKNKNDDTPLDLINDFKIMSFYLKEAYQLSTMNNKVIDSLSKENRRLENKIDVLYSSINFLLILLFIFQIFLYLFLH